jgi:Flp pilus assembly protein TadD
MPQSQPVRPFDARFTLLEDREVPSERWRTVSLVTVLRETLLRDPDGLWFSEQEDRRIDALTVAAHELTSRGIDAPSLLRYGMLPELAVGVVSIVFPVWLGERLVEELEPSAAHWTEELLPRLGPAPTDDEDRASAMGSITEALFVICVTVANWAIGAPVEDLIRLAPPTSEREQHTAASVDIPDMDLIKQYRWLVERLSITRLEDWSTPSLHLEYRWIRGQEMAPCPVAIMADRDVAAELLATEIARRATSPGPSVEFAFPGVEFTLATQMQQRAVELLRNGRHREAIALFEFALSQSPQDSRAENNLGFCLVPEDAAAALGHLNRAVALGYEPAVVSACNRAACLLLMGDPRNCLAIAADYWAQAELVTTVTAALWRVTDGGVELVEDADSRKHLATLAAQAAKLVGNDEEARLWQTRS